MAAGGAGVGVLVVAPSPYNLVLAAVSAYLVHRFVDRLEPREVRRRRERLAAQLPTVVDLLAAALRSGAAPSSALGVVASVVDAPMREELALSVAKLDLGADPVEVWRAMARHPQLGPVGRALERATESGASVQEGLQRLAEELHAVRRAQVMVAARSVETKAAAPLGLCLLPAFILIAGVPVIVVQLGSLSFALF